MREEEEQREEEESQLAMCSRERGSRATGAWLALPTKMKMREDGKGKIEGERK